MKYTRIKLAYFSSRKWDDGVMSLMTGYVWEKEKEKEESGILQYLNMFIT